MKVDQNSPSAWLGVGAVFVLVGLVVAGATPDSPGLGRVLMCAGAALMIVGLAIFVVRAGTRREN